MSNVNQSLGKRIKSFRLSRSLSQDKLAELAGISPKYLGEVERGVGNISIKHLTRLAEALSVTLTDIMDLDHEQGREELIECIKSMSDSLNAKDAQVVYRLIKMLTNQ